VAVASAGPYANLNLDPDTQPCQHPITQFFTGWVPFLLPNQQRQSTEGIKARFAHTVLFYFLSLSNLSYHLFCSICTQLIVHAFQVVVVCQTTLVNEYDDDKSQQVTNSTIVHSNTVEILYACG